MENGEKTLNLITCFKSLWPEMNTSSDSLLISRDVKLWRDNVKN